MKLSLTQDIKKNEVCEKRQNCENKPLKVYNKGFKNERVVCKTYIIHFYVGGHFLCTLTKVDDIVRKSIFELHCLSKVMWLNAVVNSCLDAYPAWSRIAWIERSTPSLTLTSSHLLQILPASAALLYQIPHSAFLSLRDNNTVALISLLFFLWLGLVPLTFISGTDISDTLCAWHEYTQNRLLGSLFVDPSAIHCNSVHLQHLHSDTSAARPAISD